MKNDDFDRAAADILQGVGRSELDRLLKLTVSRMRRLTVPEDDRPHLRCRDFWSWFVYEHQWCGAGGIYAWQNEAVERVFEKRPPKIPYFSGIAATFVAFEELNEFEDINLWKTEPYLDLFAVTRAIVQRSVKSAKEQSLSWLNQEGWLRPLGVGSKSLPNLDPPPESP